MAKKELILDGVHYALGADAENVDYTNAGMTGVTNAEGALDNLHSRVDAIEHPNTDVVYTEEDCTLTNKAVWSNQTEEGDKTGYNCTDFIPIPAGTKMYIKMNFTFNSQWPLLFYTYQKWNTYSWMIGKNFTGGSLAEYTEVAIPDNAVAIRFNFPVDSNNHISIKFVQQPAIEDVVKLKVGAWNMGHFSGGRNDYSTITDTDVAEKRAAYRKVFDRINADILCLSEFDPTFNTTVHTAIDESTQEEITVPNPTSREEILLNYPYYKIGGKSGFNCNAVFSKLPILQTQEMSYTEKGANRYFKEVTLKINGKIVKVIATHLNEENQYHTENNGITQLQELVSIYADYPYVIIGADFNLHITDRVGPYVSGNGGDGYLNYQILTNAGYTLLRFDYLDNDMLPNPLSQSTADNIAVKGFAMGKREFIYEQGVSETLSDHCMVACELVML